jgi:hypothetical protein
MDLLEQLRGIRIIRVAIWMIAQGQTAILTLNVGFVVIIGQ